MAKLRICAVPDCGKVAHCKDYCGGHYHKLMRYGNPLEPHKIDTNKLGWLLENSKYPGDECLLWPYKSESHGHGSVRYNGKYTTASRVMCEIVHGQEPIDGMHAAHSCNNGHIGCMTPRHLRWATPKENAADRIEAGTHHVGEKTSSAKLKEIEVAAIIRRLSSGEKLKDLAEDYGVHIMTISDIKRGKTWTHVRMAA